MADKFVIAKSIADAASLKNRNSAFLAGGTEINRLNSLVKAKTLVSISKLDMKGIEKTTENSSSVVRIGALATFQEIADSKLVPQYLKDACLFMSSRQKRDMATIGGNISICRDDSYLISTLLACGAKLTVVSPKKKKSLICLSDFVANRKDYSDFLIENVLIDENVKVVSKRYSNTAASHGYLTVSAARHGKSACVAVCAKNSGIYFYDNGKVGSIRFKDDIFGSPEYKKYLLEVTVKQLLEEV